MTEAKYIGTFSPILNDDWTDHVPSYYSYYDFYKKRTRAKKQLKKERMVFFTVCFMVICFALSAFSIFPESRENYDDCPVHAVSYGETLWSIANEYKSDDVSTGEFIYEIKKANDMTTSEISAGDVLVIPISL